MKSKNIIPVILDESKLETLGFILLSFIFPRELVSRKDCSPYWIRKPRYLLEWRNNFVNKRLCWFYLLSGKLKTENEPPRFVKLLSLLSILEHIPRPHSPPSSLGKPVTMPIPAQPPIPESTPIYCLP